MGTVIDESPSNLCAGESWGQKAKGPNVSWLATLVTHLDNPDGFTRDAPVCMHRLHTKRGSGVLGVMEAVFHTFNLAIDEVTEVTGVSIFQVIVVVVVILLEILLFRAHSTDEVLPLSEFVRADVEG